MSFSLRAKLTALAIVHIFETAKPFGDYAAVAVLNDGAGVSYGINQFTHRSGSLYKVCNTYLGEGGSVGADAIEAVLPDLRAQRNIANVSKNTSFKRALKLAAATPEMRLAQQMIAENFYLQPAIDACKGSSFVLPLSLAVVYDSINHGSYGKIRDRVSTSDRDERAWITEYVKDRDAWLEGIPRLAVTDYRTDFFLAQIARGNWHLALPLNVHGFRLTDADIDAIDDQREAVGEPDNSSATAQLTADPEPLTEDAPALALASGIPTSNELSPGQQQEAGNFPAYTPQIDTAKSWITRALAGTSAGAALAYIADLPQWMQIGLFSLIALVIVGAIVVFVKYHDKIFAYVTNMNTLRATPSFHNPVVGGRPPQ